MTINKIKKMFENGSVFVCGQRGAGKDMLIANVVARRKKRYVSNVDYTGDDRYIPFVPRNFDCGENTYKNFIEGNIKPYIYPYEDGVDVYISDAGVYFPSQYCNELNKLYPYFPTFLALSRHAGDADVHVSVQNFSRVWVQMREQSDSYIYMLGTKVLFGKIVLQKLRVYELAESCERRVPLYKGLWCLPFTDMWMMQRIRRNEYYVQHGQIKEHVLIYWNKSNYDTRVFKKMMEGEKDEKK